MYEYKEKYILDFTSMKDWRYFHAIIAKEFDFPDHYGRNWSAFWDCMVDLLLSNKNLNIEIIGLDKIYDENKKDVDLLIKILKRLKHVYNDEYFDAIKIVIHHGGSLVELT